MVRATAGSRRSGGLRAALTAIAIGIIAGGLAGCSSPAEDAYDVLDAIELAYVIPGSEKWGAGDPCPDGGDCAPAGTVDDVKGQTWHRVESVADSSGKRTVTIAVESTDPDGAVQRMTLRAWGPDARTARSVLEGGYELWMGISSEGLDLHGTQGYVTTFAAIDDEGRIAGVGRAEAANFTVPVAQAAAEAQADSAAIFFATLTGP